MNLVYNTTTKNLSEFEDYVEEEKLSQLITYERTNKSGGGVKMISYKAVSNGKVDSQTWVKKYLSEDKENLYLKALQNLYRKLDFIELNQALDMEDISEEEFDKELEENESKYLIPSPSGPPTLQQVIQVANIIKKLGREDKMSVDEVSELFSLEMDKAIEVLQSD